MPMTVGREETSMGASAVPFGVAAMVNVEGGDKGLIERKKEKTWKNERQTRSRLRRFRPSCCIHTSRTALSNHHQFTGKIS